MRNLKPYPDDTTDFFDNVVNARRMSKTDPAFLTRIATYRPGVIRAYTTYNTHFASNQLMSAVAVGHVNPIKADLIKLYRYRAKVFQELKIRMTTDENKRLVNTCQNCTINAINSFDHVLPKDEFPEFAVNPKNLFPSCTECNGYKSTNWKNGINPVFLNLVLDVLPDQQYLFVTAVVVGDDIELEYEVDNPNGIDPAVFTLIDSHYDNLYLTKRFTENSGDIITELINSILTFKTLLSEPEIRDVVIRKALRDLGKFGSNYWKALAVIALINSAAFYQYALDQE